MPVLDVKDLCKSYGETRAVDHISFSVARGEILGLLGPNGAGKTTTINMILGLLSPTSGAVEIDGIDIASERPKALARTNFAAVYAELPGNLTVREALRIFGMLYDVVDLPKRITTLLEEFDLVRFADTRVGLLSSGEQTRVSLAKAALNAPRLLLLDEPTASVDPATAKGIRADIVRIVRERGGGVLWTSHNMYEVEEVCDRVLFLSHGTILLSGDPKTLPKEHAVANLEELFIKIACESLEQ